MKKGCVILHMGFCFVVRGFDLNPILAMLMCWLCQELVLSFPVNNRKWSVVLDDHIESHNEDPYGWSIGRKKGLFCMWDYANSMLQYKCWCC